MSSPQRPAPPDPTADPALPQVDSSLFELDGRAYKDLSRPAAAQRAAYHQARTVQFLASLSSAPAAEETPMAARPAAAGGYYADFTNFGTSPYWTPEYGTQEAGGEGWIMHSDGNTSSRMRFNYTLNDGSSPYTRVIARLRGAPDNGKNSYVTLIEQSCADNPGGKYACDEIDIVEYYGQTSYQRSEFTVYQNGQQGSSYTMVWPTQANDPGHTQTYYNIYLEPGNYLWWGLYDLNGNFLGSWDKHSSDGYIPTRPMNLYVGIWDIGASLGICVDNPPGSFTGDSWMALSLIEVDIEVNA
jgi:hypothetical protein